MYCLKDKKLLVTGANGYVGRNLIRSLKEKGYRVIAATRDEKYLQFFERMGVEHRVLNFFNANELEKNLHDIDVVFHVAADLRNWGKATVSSDFNVTGTKNLLNAVKQRANRFVLVSTEAIFLGRENLVDLDDTTAYPVKSIGSYARSKKTTEQIVLQSSVDNFSCMSVRPRMVWGRDDTTILPKLKKAIAAGRFLWIEHGQYLTSTTHIDNLCEVLELAAMKGVGGKSYFVTDGAPIFFREFVSHLLSNSDGLIPTKSIPRKLAMLMGVCVEWVWGVLDIESPPPITCSQVLLTGSPVTIDDSRARQELGYVGISFEKLKAGISKIQI
ncbi:NAD-dependent epimerase/dehydratase family protein [Herbaspirillum sp. RTI4]|uniref:NAD-dependent epimerase/dehydratase family protein n=1 Tax=Herbaspirillum sp. RTI4 TaxID=3048640 RepID=UPI002AB4008B|nr:NAD-dependent epimerase/dehydratase family protein [Herbaspirillum sp. RTI4]MDY7577619.1 NAD-dependent epimerase/dehydratase family protein [Herbaspirillum sp. RTI4]MEA9982215.1 NAD-dependent epimerase/dehydratase family protein [Herbaspirillum sp. RTI4]